MKKNTVTVIIGIVLLIAVAVLYFSGSLSQTPPENETASSEVISTTKTNTSPEENQGIIKPEYKISSYAGKPYIFINNNRPKFTGKDMTTVSYESYAHLDSLGRCSVCTACLGRDLMPKDERGDISTIHPSGWHSVKFDFVDGKSVYNRCHLIAFNLAGENANEKNLITGTRYLNTEGMLPFENLVADYIVETGNHVLYRVCPIFEGDNLVVNGVTMEGYSVEDDGEGICFNVFCYNVQPGVTINYATGECKLSGEKVTTPKLSDYRYVANKGSHKFHRSDCPNGESIGFSKRYLTNDRDELLSAGYMPSGCCNP